MRVEVEGLHVEEKIEFILRRRWQVRVATVQGRVKTESKVIPRNLTDEEEEGKT